MDSTELRATALANLLDRVEPSRVLTDQDIEHFRHLFASLDADGNGLISREELRELYVDEAAVDYTMKVGDLNGDGQLSFEELIQTSARQKLETLEQRAWAVFSGFDVDGDGSVERSELAAITNVDPSASASMTRVVLEAAIGDDEDTIHYAEFLLWFVDRQLAKTDRS